MITLILCVVLSPALTVEADTAQDIYDIYGIQHDTALSRIQKDLKAAKKKYDDVEHEYNINTMHNVAVEGINMNDVRSDLSTAQGELIDKGNALMSAIDLSREQIRELELEYMRIESKIEFLCETVNSYSNIYQKNADYQTVVDAERKVLELTNELDIAKEEANIGEVKQIYHPLSTNYEVKQAYSTDRPYIVLAAGKGVPVMAQWHGVVVEAGYSKKKGEYVTIDHGEGVLTEYHHLKSRYVKEDDVVKQYDRIGKTTNNGLEFKLILQEQAVDPALLFSKERSRDEQETKTEQR